MLKRIYRLTEEGIRAIYKSAVWLTVFEVIAAFPIILIMMAISEMLDVHNELSVGKYIIMGTLILVAMFLTYKKMYHTKYVVSGKENNHLRMVMADKIRKLPLSYLSKRDVSDLTSAIMDDIVVVEGVITNGIIEFLSGLITGIVILIGMCFLNVKLTLCLASCLPVACLAMALSRAVSGGANKKNREIKLEISDGVQEYLENIKTLKCSSSMEQYQKKLEHNFKRIVPHLVLFEFLAGATISIAYNVMRMGIALVIAVGANMLATGEITPLTYLAFLLVSVRVYEPLSAACEMLGSLIASLVAAERINDILDYPEQEGTEALETQRADICFEHVSFGYEDRMVLQDISFAAKQGEITTLVGPSGCGKSTICRLAARFWDIDKGNITVGGQDIRSVYPESLLGAFSIVFQDVMLFNDTIYNNILIGKKDATKEEVMRAAELAQCMSFIDKLPEGMDTVIGENGHTLSGGERQRLSIARAFLKDAPIILLDESTASLDPENETKIQKAVQLLTRGKTVLMIAHQLRTIVNSDNIVVLNQGGIEAQGTHSDLMKQGGLYKKLYELQQGG